MSISDLPVQIVFVDKEKLANSSGSAQYEMFFITSGCLKYLKAFSSQGAGESKKTCIFTLNMC